MQNQFYPVPYFGSNSNTNLKIDPFFKSLLEIESYIVVSNVKNYN